MFLDFRFEDRTVFLGLTRPETSGYRNDRSEVGPSSGTRKVTETVDVQVGEVVFSGGSGETEP